MDILDLTRYHVIIDTAMWGADEIVSALLVFARDLAARRTRGHAGSAAGGGRSAGHGAG